MSCLSPIEIVNPCKYVSLKYRDRFLLHVPCGHCAECQRNLSNQWLFRTWQECTDIVRCPQNSFIYFDSLSYSDSFLPHMDEYIPDLPHISCFRSKDLRNFLQALRLELLRKYNVVFRYFISSEYGHDRLYVSDSGRIRKGTIRPHYHTLFFVYGDIQPLEFSKLVSRYWKYGSTDGYPFKGHRYVIDHNTIFKDSIPANYLRACSYVTKYVQKSASFDKLVESRLNIAMYNIAEKMPENWIDSVNAKRLRIKLKRNIGVFHRQSQGFGASYLEDLDLKQLFENGCLFMPSNKGVKIAVSLPSYYKRKLFYDLITVDGVKVWKLNDLGLEYNNYRHDVLVSQLADVFLGYSVTFKLDIDEQKCYELAEYVYDFQGRIKADKPSNDLLEKLPSVTLFNYCTLSDREHLGQCGITDKFIGNNTIGYSDNLINKFNYRDFIKSYVIFDEEKESLISKIYSYVIEHNKELQSAYELEQRLIQVYRQLR